MDELENICKEMLYDPANEFENNKTFEQESIIDVNKLILRIDGLENENKELSDKLEKLINDLTILTKRINDNTKINDCSNRKNVLRHLKDDHNISTVRIYFTDNNSEKYSEICIYNEYKITKELKNMDLIEENLSYIKKDKFIIKLLDTYKLITLYLTQLSNFKREHNNKMCIYGYICDSKYNKYKTIDGKTLSDRLTGHMNRSNDIGKDLRRYLSDIRAFGTFDAEYDLRPIRDHNKISRGNESLIEYFSPETVLRIKQYNENAEYCRNNFEKFIKYLRDVQKIKKCIKID